MCLACTLNYLLEVHTPGSGTSFFKRLMPLEGTFPWGRFAGRELYMRFFSLLKTKSCNERVNED